MTSILNVTSITGLQVGGLPAGVVNNTTLAASSVTADKLGTTNKLIRFTRITYNTRTAWNDATDAVIWTQYVTKERSDTSLFVDVELSMRGNYSDHLMHEMQYASSSWFQGTQPYDAGFTANARPYKSTFFLTGITSTGSNLISLRWRTVTVTSGNKPAVIWNPNSSDDNRLSQEYSCMNIWEIY